MEPWYALDKLQPYTSPIVPSSREVSKFLGNISKSRPHVSRADCMRLDGIPQFIGSIYDPRVPVLWFRAGSDMQKARHVRAHCLLQSEKVGPGKAPLRLL